MSFAEDGLRERTNTASPSESPGSAGMRINLRIKEEALEETLSEASPTHHQKRELGQV